MKLSLFIVSISSMLSIASAKVDEYDNEHGLIVKRDHGLPYSTLPNASCSKPATCNSISGTVTCRCSDTITVCLNTGGDYCWGSISLNQTTCPTVPSTCSSTLTGSNTTCLCDSKHVLCVDNANNYCYGSVSGSAVVLTALPYASSAASSSAATALVTTTTTATTKVVMSIVAAPSVSTTATGAAITKTSGVERLTTASMMTIVTAFITFILLFVEF